MDSGFMEIIRPSVDLRKNYPEMAKLCKQNKRPIAVTVNGRADTVLMSHQQFLEMRAELDFYEHLTQSEEDIRLGRTTNADKVFDRLENDLRAAANGL